MSWERCGNTPYYRKEGKNGGGFYSNPFSWSQISVSIERDGSATVLYRKAPRYDWEVLKGGIHTLADSKEERIKFLRSTHGWAADLIRAHEMQVKLPELRKMFEEAPVAAREEVLDGVGALLNGYDDEELNETFKATPHAKTPKNDSVTIVVVEKGSQAFQDFTEQKETDEHVDKFIVAESLAGGIEEALADVGIHEC